MVFPCGSHSPCSDRGDPVFDSSAAELCVPLCWEIPKRKSLQLSLACEAICNKCTKRGHFAKVCKSQAISVTIYSTHIARINVNVSDGLLHSATHITIQDEILSALLDPCASEGFISENIVNSLADNNRQR